MQLDSELASSLELEQSRITGISDIARSPEARLRIASRLRYLEFSYWEPIASILVRDPSSRVREQLALSLGATADEGTIRHLKRLASDGVWKVRQKVAQATIEHRSKALFPMVAQLLHDHVPEVRATALRAYVDFRAFYPKMAAKLQQDLIADVLHTPEVSIPLGDAISSRFGQRGEGWDVTSEAVVNAVNSREVYIGLEEAISSHPQWSITPEVMINCLGSQEVTTSLVGAISSRVSQRAEGWHVAPDLVVEAVNSQEVNTSLENMLSSNPQWPAASLELSRRNAIPGIVSRSYPSWLPITEEGSLIDTEEGYLSRFGYPDPTSRVQLDDKPTFWLFTESLPESETPESPPPQEDTDKLFERFVNTWFEHHPGPLVPLQYKKAYTLGIQVGPTPRKGTFTREDLVFSEPKFGQQDMLDVVVAIVTDDFEVLDSKSAQRMQLPKDKTQPSSVATFEVKPVKNNPEDAAVIHILFYHENNLFHEAQVGADVQVRSADVVDVSTDYLTAAKTLQAPMHARRDANLLTKKLRDGSGYQFIFFYDFGGDDFDVLWCNIPMDRDIVEDVLSTLHSQVTDVLDMGVPAADKRYQGFFYRPEQLPAVAAGEGQLPNLYRVGDDTYNSALAKLAEAGLELYNSLFLDQDKGNKRERDRAARVGEALRQLSSSRPLKIQVVAEDFFIPWNLLYDGDLLAGTIRWESFWGFKHIIEEVPYGLRADDESVETIAVEKPPPKLGMNLNRIDISEMLTEPQLAFSNRYEGKAKFSYRFSEAEVQAMLQGKHEECQLEYFYCHAGTEGKPGRRFDQSFLGLTSASSGLTLQKIRIYTAGRRFQGTPLLFLNACESAQMDGRFYYGFVPKFLNMGSCAVVGTDCEVPSLFGAHFGIAFLETFLQGTPVGEALLSLRKDFRERYQNPFGLIYRVFGNADACLQRDN